MGKVMVRDGDIESVSGFTMAPGFGAVIAGQVTPSLAVISINERTIIAYAEVIIDNATKNERRRSIEE